MSDVAIRVNNLTKQFHIGQLQRGYKTFREVAVDLFFSPFRKMRGLVQGHASGASDLSDTIWALRDIDFEVHHGEVVGIIGHNGAGKSTLLKILSRITEPTKGFVEVEGRVGSLLEVGTGFHPELTGRENTYLNGAILGMHKAQIDRKFDEIVAFADIERFLDTPVKHYSSGMQTRLGFAVAAHLESEILLVDEVLSVGDVNFQKKCLNKMHDVSQQGRTVVFISHNLPTVVRLCPRVILLDQGHLVLDGSAQEAVSKYLDSGSGCTAVREWPDLKDAPGGEVARLLAVRVRGEDGEIQETFDIRHPVAIEIEYQVLKSGYVLMPFHHVFDQQGVQLFSAHDLDPQWRGRPRPAGHYVSTAWVSGNLLNEGLHLVSSGIATIQPPRIECFKSDVVAFHLVDSPGGDTARGDWHYPLTGAVRPALEWTTTLRLSDGSPAPAVPPREVRDPAILDGCLDTWVEIKGRGHSRGRG
jgi:homopolymeric O-antigen transport system ATP-binding protein